MAKINYNGNIRSIRGKLYGYVFCEWKPGVYVIKRKPEHVKNPRTPAQTAVRDFQKLLGGKWRQLEEVKQCQWEAAAKLIRPKNNPESGVRVLIHTSSRNMTGFNLFVKTNQLLRSIGRTEIIEEPLFFMYEPYPVTELKAAWDGSRLIVSWGDILDAAADPIRDISSNVCQQTQQNSISGGAVSNGASQYVRVWISSEQRRFHKQLAVSASALDKSVEITKIRDGGGQEISFENLGNSAILFQADVVDKITGWVSSPSKTIRLFLTANQVL